jgi:hypothetical protein
VAVVCWDVEGWLMVVVGACVGEGSAGGVSGWEGEGGGRVVGEAIFVGLVEHAGWGVVCGCPAEKLAGKRWQDCCSPQAHGVHLRVSRWEGKQGRARRKSILEVR